MSTAARAHVAIVRPVYARAILAGHKTAEIRLTKFPKPPWHAIEPGDTVFFKQTSGPIVASACAAAVYFVACGSAADVARLRARYNHAVLGEDAFWEAKAAARYATVVELAGVRPCASGPELPPLSVRGRAAWIVLGAGVAAVRGR